MRNKILFVFIMSVTNPLTGKEITIGGNTYETLKPKLPDILREFRHEISGHCKKEFSNALNREKLEANSKIKECQKTIKEAQKTEIIEELSPDKKMKYLEILTQLELWLIDRAVIILDSHDVEEIFNEGNLVSTMCTNMIEALKTQM